MVTSFGFLCDMHNRPFQNRYFATFKLGLEGFIMRRISAALAAIYAIAFSQLASAADLPRKAPVAPAIVPYNWTGFYVGVNAGYTWGPWDASSNQIIFDPSATHDAKVNGGLVGLQAGYNWQAGGWVYGLEGDIQYTGAKDTDAWTAPGVPPPPPPTTPPPQTINDFLPGPAGGGPMSFTHEWKFPWFGTLRGRLGVLPAERWLLYVTGGLAFGEVIIGRRNSNICTLISALAQLIRSMWMAFRFMSNTKFATTSCVWG